MTLNSLVRRVGVRRNVDKWYPDAEHDRVSFDHKLVDFSAQFRGEVASTGQPDPVTILGFQFSDQFVRVGVDDLDPFRLASEGCRKDDLAQVRVGALDSRIESGLLGVTSHHDGVEVLVCPVVDSECFTGMDWQCLGVLLDDPRREVALKSEEIELAHPGRRCNRQRRRQCSRSVIASGDPKGRLPWTANDFPSHADRHLRIVRR